MMLWALPRRDLLELDGGGFVAFHSELEGADRDTSARRYDDALNPVGDPFRVNGDPIGNQTWPTRVGLEGGRFVITWEAKDGEPPGRSRSKSPSRRSQSASPNGAGIVADTRKAEPRRGNAAWDVAPIIAADAKCCACGSTLGQQPDLGRMDQNPLDN